MKIGTLADFDLGRLLPHLTLQIAESSPPLDSKGSIDLIYKIKMVGLVEKYRERGGENEKMELSV